MLKSNLRDTLSSEIKDADKQDEEHRGHDHHREVSKKESDEILIFNYPTYNDFFRSTSDDDIKCVQIIDYIVNP